MVEVPRDDPIQLPLSVLAPFNGGPTHICPRVLIQPLLAEHREEGREKRGSEARVEDGLDLDHSAGRAGPLREGGRVISECSIVDLVDENTGQGSSLFARVGLELRLDVEDEGRSDGGEQTGL